MTVQIGRERGGCVLRCDLSLPRRHDDVFRFFADARNLEAITPPWLRFEVLTSGPIEMRLGVVIDYRLRIHGLPMRWRSEITAWDPPLRFVDEQRRGPYRWWIHEHAFEEAAGGTRVVDHVRYGPPGGAIVDRLFVRRDLRRIFEHRSRTLKALFPER